MAFFGSGGTLSNLWGGAKDFFGGKGGLLGAGLSAYGASRMAKPSYDKDYLAQLTQQLFPLQESADKFGELAGQYEDPNSEMNQRMRRDIRTQNLEGFSDIARRQRNQATGVYGDSPGVDSNMLSSAIAQALQSHSMGASDRMKTSIGLRGQQSQLLNALAQGGMQNRLLAGQQSQFMPQYLAQTGMGLLNRALYPKV